nr:formaldehyde-activating enzyme [Methanothrix thermoacetophila]
MYQINVKGSKGVVWLDKDFSRTLVGEALVGDGPEVAHIDLVIGPKGGAVDAAFVTSLASPRKGHTPFLRFWNRICLRSPQL